RGPPGRPRVPPTSGSWPGSPRCCGRTTAPGSPPSPDLGTLASASHSERWSRHALCCPVLVLTRLTRLFDRFARQFFEFLLESGPAGDPQAAGGVVGDVDAIDRCEHAPAEPRVHLPVVREVTGHHPRGVADQLATVPRRERSRRRDDERVEAEIRGAL